MNPIEDLILKMIYIKEQKNGINDGINDTKLLGLIKQSSLIFRCCLSWSDHSAILFLLARLSFDLVLSQIISQSCLY